MNLIISLVAYARLLAFSLPSEGSANVSSPL